MKGTRAVLKQLNEEGYTLTYEYLRYLLRNFFIPEPPKFNNGWAWDKQAIKYLKQALKKRNRGPQ